MSSAKTNRLARIVCKEQVQLSISAASQGVPGSVLRVGVQRKVWLKNHWAYHPPIGRHPVAGARAQPARGL